MKFLFVVIGKKLKLGYQQGAILTNVFILIIYYIFIVTHYYLLLLIPTYDLFIIIVIHICIKYITNDNAFELKDTTFLVLVIVSMYQQDEWNMLINSSKICSSIKILYRQSKLDFIFIFFPG